MKKIFFLALALLSITLFIVGNYVYNTQLDTILKVAISELSFIILYTMIDKFNIKYGLKFSLFSLICFVIFYLPHFEFLFYSKYVQYFSVSISLMANIVNILLVKKLLNKGLQSLICSRISTFLASVLEVSLFVYLLEIGLVGLIYTIAFRLLYIYTIPKILFYRKLK